MTVLESIQRGAEFLRKKGVDSPRLNAELLLSQVLDLPRLQLYLNFERVITDHELAQLREMIQRRARRVPLQQIVGFTSFCGLEIQVNEHVLSPRPETELLAEAGWRWLSSLPEGGAPRLLDLGAGSGCIALAILAHCPGATAWAVDLSTEALALARANAERLGLAARIQFGEGDLFAALPEGARFELIVTNPPYIPTGEIASLEPEVRDHEPRAALDGGADGLRFYRGLAEQGARHLEPGGRLIAEFGDGQAEAVRDLFLAKNWIVEAVRADYTQRPRIIIARQPQD